MRIVKPHQPQLWSSLLANEESTARDLLHCEGDHFLLSLASAVLRDEQGFSPKMPISDGILAQAFEKIWLAHIAIFQFAS